MESLETLPITENTINEIKVFTSTDNTPSRVGSLSAAMETTHCPTKKYQFSGKASHFCYAFSSIVHSLHILKTDEAPMFYDSKLSP